LLKREARTRKIPNRVKIDEARGGGEHWKVIRK